MEELAVADVMTTDVVTAREDTPFKELVELMESKGVGGIPVCAGDRRLVGIVTETDLLRFLSGHPKPAHGRVWLEWLVRASHPRSDETPDMTAHELMTTPVISIRPGTPIRQGAQRLLESGVRRLPVVDHEGHLIGIVSRQDLLRPYLRSDESIRDEVVEQLVKQTLWIDPETITVVVSQGVVELHGRVARRSQRDILMELTKRVDGVVSVVDRLSSLEDDRQVPPQWLEKASSEAEPWSRVAHSLGYRGRGRP